MENAYLREKKQKKKIHLKKGEGENIFVLSSLN
jgi:hypothetical protein